MTTLSAQRVEEIFRDCHTDIEDPDDPDTVLTDGIVWMARLDKAKLGEHAAEIGAMLMELPEQFLKSGGGGWSFLQACEDRNGVQWTGLHLTMGMLFCLGQGTGYATYLLPRDMWAVLPGGMPYVVVNDDLIGAAA